MVFELANDTPKAVNRVAKRKRVVPDGNLALPAYDTVSFHLEHSKRVSPEFNL